MIHLTCNQISQHPVTQLDSSGKEPQLSKNMSKWLDCLLEHTLAQSISCMWHLVTWLKHNWTVINAYKSLKGSNLDYFALAEKNYQ